MPNTHQDDAEMTRPLRPWEVACIFGEFFGKLGIFVSLALVFMLAADDVLRLFPQVQGTLRLAIMYGVGCYGSGVISYFLGTMPGQKASELIGVAVMVKGRSRILRAAMTS